MFASSLVFSEAKESKMLLWKLSVFKNESQESEVLPHHCLAVCVLLKRFTGIKVISVLSLLAVTEWEVPHTLETQPETACTHATATYRLSAFVHSSDEICLWPPP